MLSSLIDHNHCPFFIFNHSLPDSIRENRQENEIRDARAQVQEARMKEAELDARLKSLERMQYPNAVSP